MPYACTQGIQAMLKKEQYELESEIHFLTQAKLSKGKGVATFSAQQSGTEFQSPEWQEIQGYIKDLENQEQVLDVKIGQLQQRSKSLGEEIDNVGKNIEDDGKRVFAGAWRNTGQ